MLDDHQYVHNLDKGNALSVIAGQPNQLKQEFEIRMLSPRIDVKNVVVAGMGGSALGAEFVRSWASDRLTVPLVIVRDYSLPAFVGEGTLLVVSSYSGNTEEALSALKIGQNTGATIVIMSSGGQLKEEAQDKFSYIQIPSGFAPRLAMLYQAKALTDLLVEAGVLTAGLIGELEDAADWVSHQLGSWTMDSPTRENQAKQIAEELVGHPVVIYGGPTLAFPAMKWKIALNENAKNSSFYYHWPEFSHNEFQGWSFPREKTFKVVELQSSVDHPEITRRFEISNRLLSGQMPSPIIVKAQGETRLQQMVWALILGDFVGAYLAFLNGIDPTPVELVEKLKKELAS